MTTPGPNVEMVTIPLAELDAMKAELREYRLAAGRAEAAPDQGVPGPGDRRASVHCRGTRGGLGPS